MFSNDQALAAARIIRSVLPEEFGLDLDVVSHIDDQLAEILNHSELTVDDQVDRLLEILDGNPQTKVWLSNFLEQEGVIEEDSTRGLSYLSLPGDPTSQPRKKYSCPINNDCIWYREGNREIKLCPTHLVSLVPDNS
jgi:hypothetical protein